MAGETDGFFRGKLEDKAIREVELRVRPSRHLGPWSSRQGCDRLETIPEAPPNPDH